MARSFEGLSRSVKSLIFGSDCFLFLMGLVSVVLVGGSVVITGYKTISSGFKIDSFCWGGLGWSGSCCWTCLYVLAGSFLISPLRDSRNWALYLLLRFFLASLMEHQHVSFWFL